VIVSMCMARIVPRGEKRSINAGSTPRSEASGRPDDGPAPGTGARRRAEPHENTENFSRHRG
jgi:hypothetical protein